jgi:hypothetical protein
VSGELLTPGEVLALLRDSFLRSVADHREEEPGWRTPREEAVRDIVVTF